MTLATRCPHCATAFRVLPGQLAAKAGRVRCGKCGAVFDGVAQLVEPAAPLPHEPSPQLGLFEPGRGRAKTAPLPGSGSPHNRAETATEAPMVEFLAEPTPVRRFSVVWGMLAVLGFAALLGQVLHHYRTEIGVLVPDARSYLALACEFAGCEVRLPRRPDLLSIESSELQADGQRDAVIVLNAVLRNRAPFPQEYPALELTLTNAAEEPVARRVLAPPDYLRERRDLEFIERGLAAGAEVVLRVPLDTRQVNASGYRLYLFFP
jgi:predicted Zn finger-like uncharacterized protein